LRPPTDRARVAATPVGAGDDDLLEEPMHEPPALLRGQPWPGAQEIAVAEFIRQGRLRADVGECRPRLIEGPLACLHPLNELLLTQEREQLRVVHEQVELVLGL
jgi:hypothetical protein